MGLDDFYSAFSGGADDEFGSGTSSWDSLNSTISNLGNLAGSLVQAGQQLQQQGAQLPQSVGIVQQGGASGVKPLLFGLSAGQLAIAGIGLGIIAIIVVRNLRR